MLFSVEQSASLIKNVEEYVRGVSVDEKTTYVKTLANELCAWMGSKIELRTFKSGKIFDEARDKVSSALKGGVVLEGLEVAHFEVARLLRTLSYGGFHDFNESPIVRFYLCPKFDFVNQRFIDFIRFNIPSEFVFEPQKEAIDKILAQAQAVEGWDKKLEEWKVRVEDSEKRYQSVIGGNNYLGLANAFAHLLQQKNVELQRVFVGVSLVGLSALLVPALYVLIGNSDKLVSFMSGKFDLSSVSVFTFSIVFEALLLYYFRIVYARWCSLKHQILQLSLRHQMCAFANEYAATSKEMDRSVLGKFENLVFSELSQDSNAPPNLYDAADAIAKVIGSIRK